MKGLTALLVVLTVAEAADATLTLVAPAAMNPGEMAGVGIDVIGEKASLKGALVFEGLVSIDASNVSIVNIPGISDDPFIVEVTGDPDFEAYFAGFGIFDPTQAFYYEVVDAGVPPIDIPDGALISGMVVRTDDCPLYWTVTLIDAAYDEVIASQRTSICYIPEPATVVLLGFGTLAFVRWWHGRPAACTQTQVRCRSNGELK